MDSLRRDLTADEEEKMETTVQDFLADKSDKDLNLGNREEMMFCVKYMKQLLKDKDDAYGKEISVLRDQISNLKTELGDYLAKEGSVSFAQSRVNKENDNTSEPVMVGQAIYPRQMDPRFVEKNGSLEMKKRKIGFSRQAIVHGRVPQFGPGQNAKNENSPFIGDYAYT